MKHTALIMAGGRGERFWPKSRKDLPKQFLSLTDDGKTMIQLTVERILPLVALEDIYIATNKNYKSLVLAQLPGIPEENILCEPVGRNTAPCIGLGAVHIAKKYDDAIMMVLPSDHLIKCNDIFVDTLREASSLAMTDSNLVTLGITPAYPETGYGYIKFHGNQVERFVEKPNLELAKEYLVSGSYLWNSGMFIWKVSSILANIKTFMPDSYERLLHIQAAVATPEENEVLENEFPLLEATSIDYGIMEKASDIYVLPGNFGWDDVGSWLAVGRIREQDECGNTVQGNVITVNTNRCVLEASDKLLAVVGLKDIIIVDTPDATLVCDKEHAGEIKQVLEQLKQNKKECYL